MSGVNPRLELTGIDAMNELAQQARFCYDISPLVKIKLLKFEETAEYLVGDTKDGVHTLLQIRNPRCSMEMILSELKWMQEILKASLIIVPEPVPGHDGGFVQTLRLPYLETDYHCVMFKFLSGGAQGGCDISELNTYSKKLGRVTALLHQSGISLNNTTLLSRSSREYELLLDTERDDNAFSGLIPAENEALIIRTLKLLKQRLEAYGMSGKRYGLIHGGLGLDNLNFFSNRITVLNFEECGCGWFLSDCGAFLSPIMHQPDARDLISLWLDGYREIRNLTREDLAEIPTFLMLHRLVIRWRMLVFPMGPARNENIPASISSTAALCENYISENS